VNAVGLRRGFLAAPVLVAAFLAGKTSSLQGQTDTFSRETNPLVLAAIRKASVRLTDPRCQRVFSDFQDREGRTLQEKLTSLGYTGQEYLEQIRFYEASWTANCDGDGVLAATSPGSRIVYLCGLKLIERTIRNPGYPVAVAVIIHEELHSLGLGENPPSSAEITRQVVSRCGG